MATTSKDLQEAILDLMAYFGAFRLPLTEAEILRLLYVKTSHLAVKAALVELSSTQQLKKIHQHYYLKRFSYPNYHNVHFLQRQLLKKAKRFSYLFRLIPFAKAVVVVNSVGLGNVHEGSDIDLLIITKPSRIYLSKAILMYWLRLIRQLETSEVKAGKFSLGLFLTTNSANFTVDMMKTNQPHLYYWLIKAKPIYGEGLWYRLLKRDQLLVNRFPNYNWPKTSLSIYANGFKLLTYLDMLGFRKHLKHTATQSKNNTPRAFIRLRSDIINLHSIDKSTQIANHYQKIRDKLKS